MTDEARPPEATAPGVDPDAIEIPPAEATLYDDPATTDLAAKVAEAWSEFDRALAEALPKLPPDTELELTLDPTATGMGEAVYAVTLVPGGRRNGGAGEGARSDATGEDGGDDLTEGRREDLGAPASAQIHAYAVSNATLPPEHRLPRTAVGELVALGWSPPGVVTGPADCFGLRLPVDQAGRVAAIVSRTLREVYGTPHPAFLLYTTKFPDGSPVEPPALGAARAVPVDGTGGPILPNRVDLAKLPLREKVAVVIAAMLKTSPENLPVDRDGDIGIRSGSAMVFVRVRENPPLVDVFSPVLTDINANEKLYVRLSELTHRMPIGRLYCNDKTVWASVPVFGRDFQPTHLMLAVQVMTGLADELDDRLHGEFGGRRFFVEGDYVQPSNDNGDAAHDRTGMYL
ncbi:MAG TPA: hypothetical protein VK028_01170 [Micromonosporaceae bacterium]|nr:hypothetical protein [Micromonosporaceae bacterium]